MKTNLVFIVAALLCLEAYAFYGPDFKPSSPGFHKRQLSKLRDSSGFRLPGTARPSLYDLSLFISIDGMTRYMNGIVTITLDVDDTKGNATYNILLNSGINFDESNGDTFKWNDGTTEFDCHLDAFSDGDFVELKCDQPINGTKQQLTITYSPTFAVDSMQGVYLVNYTESGTPKMMVTTQFEEGYARYLMPCFDEPEYKAPIRLTLNTTRNTDSDLMSSIANTKVVSVVTDSTTISTTFEQTPNMSTYLLAFVASQDYINKTDPDLKADYDFAVFARPTAEVNIAVTNGPKLIDEMGDFTGIPYVKLGNDKIALAAIPEFSAGAMENWGLITFREQILLDEGSNRTTARDTQNIIAVIAHELAHQWFGDYVTMDWWSEAWLNEGFAAYFEYYLTEQVTDNFEMMKQFVTKELQQALKTDAYPDSIPLTNNASDVTTEEDFTNEFGEISYAKGASIIRMIRYAIGDAAFKEGLNKYLTQNNYSNPTAEILINTLQEVVPKTLSINLKTILNAWIYEPGYPILTVSLDSNNTVSIQSKKFSSSLNKTGEDNTTNWWIPLTYTTSEKPNFTTIAFDWIDPAKVANFSIQIPADAWIIFNLQTAGFYRVNYDETLWNRIINVLNNSKTFTDIDVINRAQLLDDVFNIARSADGNATDLTEYYTRAFKLAEYLTYETEYYPWFTFFTEMQYLMERIQNEDTLTGLKETILKIVTPQVAVIMNASESDSVLHTEVLRRNLLLSWACRVGHENCINWADKQFENYKTNTSSINNNYRDVILCTRLANTNNSTSDFNFVYGLLEQSNLPYEGKDLARALTCMESEKWLNETLTSTVSYIYTPFSRMFFDTFLTELISGGSQKVLTALKFVLTYDYAIAQYWQCIEDPDVALKKIATKIFTKDGITKIQRYIDDNSDISTVGKKMKIVGKQALVTIDGNLAWLEKYGDILTSVIVVNGGDIPDPVTPKDNGVEKLNVNILLSCAIFMLMKLLY